jgi:hypothetical protein
MLILCFVSVKLHKYCNSAEVHEHLQEFIAMIERQPDGTITRKIRCIRTDMASYYTSATFSQYLKRQGLIQQFSAPYVPKQNGLAERLNRTLIESKRTSLHNGRLPIEFWGEALKSAAITYNYTYHSSVDGCPHKLLFGESPSLNRLQPLGTRCTYLSRDNDPKFAPKGKPAVLVGYHPDTKAYRLWDTTANKLVISYDVKFNADVHDDSDHNADPNTAEHEDPYTEDTCADNSQPQDSSQN